MAIQFFDKGVEDESSWRRGLVKNLNLLAGLIQASSTGLIDRVETLEEEVPAIGTSTAINTGTSVTFSGIPSWASIILVSLVGVSTNGSSVIRARVGTSSGATTSGYAGAACSYSGATVANFTAGFDGTGTNAAAVRHGWFLFVRENSASTIWSCQYGLGRSDTAAGEEGSGSVTLAGALDRIIITTANGTDAFDGSGVGNIWYA